MLPSSHYLPICPRHFDLVSCLRHLISSVVFVTLPDQLSGSSLSLVISCPLSLHWSVVLVTSSGLSSFSLYHVRSHFICLVHCTRSVVLFLPGRLSFSLYQVSCPFHFTRSGVLFTLPGQVSFSLYQVSCPFLYPVICLFFFLTSAVVLCTLPDHLSFSLS